MTIKEFVAKISSDFKIDNIIEFEQKIKIYHDFLQSENLKYNLTRLDSEEIIYNDYFYQSVIVYKNIHFNNIKNVLDIGSGSGIPGIVLKLIFPHIKLTIIESNNKKANFMEMLASKLSLSDVNIIVQRAENILDNQVEYFDFVTAKAVANLESIVELCVPYCKINGCVVLPKTSKYLEEVKNFPKMLKQLNCCLMSVDIIICGEMSHHVITISKKDSCSTKYPRQWACIKKGFDYEKK